MMSGLSDEVMGAAVVVLAALLDWRFGEPASAVHPVAWLGATLAPLGRRLPAWRPALAFVAGAVLWWMAVLGVMALAGALRSTLHMLPRWAELPLMALALKPAFAWRMLREEVAAVETALDRGLPAGRAQLARLCSRDVEALDATAVRETAIETLAENLNDSLVAPLFWFVVAGLPGAWIWRAVNTMDALWGYRGRWEWAGKLAARADDVLGWIPARLTAALLWRPAVPWRRVRDQARLTPSPNGGWPMATMALRLNVRLGKPGVYVLHPQGRPAGREAVVSALRAAAVAARATVVLAAVGAGLLCSGPGGWP